MELTAFQTHHYHVEANTPEEAESVAEQYFTDGEEGTVTSSDIDTTEAVPEEGEE